MMKRASLFLLLVFLPGFLFPARGAGEGSFTMAQVLSFPFPTDVATAARAPRGVWSIRLRGVRNLYVTEAPGFTLRQLTHYDEDDGQEFSSVQLSADGRWVVYVRGGEPDGNWDEELPVNPRHFPDPPQVGIWSIPFEGGTPVLLGEGTSPVISPAGDSVVFLRDGQLWGVPVDGHAPARQLTRLRGINDSPRWSPDGRHIAFRSVRGDHAFIGIFSGEKEPVVWLDPAFCYDLSPRWSPDGRRVAFIRIDGEGGEPDSILSPAPVPWRIITADIVTGEGREVWRAPATPQGSYPTTHGRTNLHWAHGRIVFLSYHDGWPHLYSVPEEGGKALLLTPGSFMAEYISMSSDGRELYFACNTGPDSLDLERRHIARVPVDRPAMEVITPGTGLEWKPFRLGESRWLLYVSATARRPPVMAVMDLKKKKEQLLTRDLIPQDFPEKELVVPTAVSFRASDGVTVHADLFMPQDGRKKHPAVIFVHGGPPRQMLLGWHYSSYYSNAYAVNQYLVSRGFVVLSVNYRLGIGYGWAFHHPRHAGPKGASEYRDIEAAGRWLAAQPFVDARHIGIYGGSYGGYLTALALARNSDLFAAGVDISGVHDRSIGRWKNYLFPESYQKAPDAEEAARTTWTSSPTASMVGWRSPVLVIHADDDRNVPFSQSTDLVQRLIRYGIPHETLVIPDDTHHFLLHRNQLRVDEATADFLIRHLKTQ